MLSLRKTGQEKIDLWTLRIMESRKSGLLDTRWYKENGIAPSSLYYWINKLRETSPSTTIIIRLKGIALEIQSDADAATIILPAMHYIIYVREYPKRTIHLYCVWLYRYEKINRWACCDY